MRKLLFLAVVLLIIPIVHANILINEIMYDPFPEQGGDANGEWIEVYNNGSAEIDLDGWKFYESGTKHSLNLAQGDSILQPNQYAVIADNSDTFLDYYWYEGTLFDSSFSLNDGEYLAILDPDGDIADTLIYSSEWGYDDEGFTLQKIYPASKSNESINWQQSLFEGGSPGEENFPEHKLVISDMWIEPEIPIQDQIVTVLINIDNLGINDEPARFVLQVDGEEFTEDFFEINSSDTLELEFELENLTLGNHALLADISNWELSAIDSYEFDFEVIVPPPADVTLSIWLFANETDPDERVFVFYAQPEDAMVSVELTVSPMGFPDILIDYFDFELGDIDEYGEIVNPIDLAPIYDYSFLDFGSYTFCASITFVQNYNDTSPENYFCENVTIQPKYKRHRTKVWLDDERYNLTGMINWVAQIFQPQNSQEINGTIIIDIRRGRAKSILLDEALGIAGSSKTFNGTYAIANNSVEGIYKLRAKFKYNSTYIESYDDGAFYLAGLEDLGEPFLEILADSRSARFGDYTTVPVKFIANNFDGRLRLIAYPDKPSHVGMDLQGKTVYQKYCEVNTAVEIDTKRGQIIRAELPIFLKSNCESKHSEGTYVSYVRACEWTGSEWKYMPTKKYKKEFSLLISGNNNNLCSSDSVSSSTSAAKPKKAKKEEVEASILLRIVSAPTEVKINEPFETKILIMNTGNSTEVLEVYSYVFLDRKCISEGLVDDWTKGWTANRQSLIVPPKSSLEFNITNRIMNNTLAREYRLRVKIKGGTKEVDTSRKINVLDEVYISEGVYESAASPSPITGKTVYVSESSSKARSIIYLVLLVSVIFNVLLIKAAR